MDSSAIVAILTRELDAAVFAAAIKQAKKLRYSLRDPQGAGIVRNAREVDRRQVLVAGHCAARRRTTYPYPCEVTDRTQVRRSIEKSTCGVCSTALLQPCQRSSSSSERFGAERRWRDDPGAVDVLALQQPGAVVAGDQVVGVARDGHRQQKRVEGIIGFDVRG